LRGEWVNENEFANDFNQTYQQFVESLDPTLVKEIMPRLESMRNVIENDGIKKVVAYKKKVQGDHLADSVQTFLTKAKDPAADPLIRAQALDAAKSTIESFPYMDDVAKKNAVEGIQDEVAGHLYNFDLANQEIPLIEQRLAEGYYGFTPDQLDKVALEFTGIKKKYEQNVLHSEFKTALTIADKGEDIDFIVNGIHQASVDGLLPPDALPELLKFAESEKHYLAVDEQYAQRDAQQAERGRVERQLYHAETYEQKHEIVRNSRLDEVTKFNLLDRLRTENQAEKSSESFYGLKTQIEYFGAYQDGTLKEGMARIRNDFEGILTEDQFNAIYGVLSRSIQEGNERGAWERSLEEASAYPATQDWQEALDRKVSKELSTLPVDEEGQFTDAGKVKAQQILQAQIDKGLIPRRAIQPIFDIAQRFQREAPDNPVPTEEMVSAVKEYARIRDDFDDLDLWDDVVSLHEKGYESARNALESLADEMLLNRPDIDDGEIARGIENFRARRGLMDNERAQELYREKLNDFDSAEYRELRETVGDFVSNKRLPEAMASQIEYEAHKIKARDPKKTDGEATREALAVVKERGGWGQSQFSETGWARYPIEKFASPEFIGTRVSPALVEIAHQNGFTFNLFPSSAAEASEESSLMVMASLEGVPYYNEGFFERMGMYDTVPSRTAYELKGYAKPTGEETRGVVENFVLEPVRNFDPLAKTRGEYTYAVSVLADGEKHYLLDDSGIPVTISISNEELTEYQREKDQEGIKKARSIRDRMSLEGDQGMRSPTFRYGGPS
jgi:hypothetical protein